MLKVKKDLTGEMFGRWKVICQAEDHISSSGKHEIAWLCECTCEKHTRKIILHRSLIYEKSKSCGCIQKEKLHNLFFNDLTGRRFGRLVAIKRVEDLITENGNVFTRWLCQCDCGNEVVVLSSALTREERPTKSCGCLQREWASEITINQYDLSNDEYGIGYTDNTGCQFIFNKEDYEKIKKYHWYEEYDGYIRSSSKDRIHLARLIMDAPDNMCVDHINHNLKDNRKSNLRIVTTSQNAMNRTLGSNNTSGATGVVWVKSQNKWKAEIKLNGETNYLGEYDNFEDAKRKRKEVEDKLFGEYSYDNSMKLGEENGKIIV